MSKSKKILVIGLCFSVSFVIVMLFLSHRTMQEPKAEPTTDEIADVVVGQSRRFVRNEGSPRSNVSGNQEKSDTATTDATPFEMTTSDPMATPNEANNLVSEAEDEEFEAQWKEVEELIKERFGGKDIGKLVEEHLADLRLRVDESVAQIEPLFEDMAFCESQLKELKRQEELQRKLGLAEEEFERQKNLADQSVAWRDFCQVEGKLNESYVFLSHFLSSEDGINQFGHVFMSTPEYAKLKTWAEDYRARQEEGIIFPSSLSNMFQN